MTADQSSPQSGNFRGEFGELALLMQRSWADNAKQSLLYSEEFLRSAFSYPGSSFELAPAIYGESGILGFVAGFPRTVLHNGRNCRLLLNSFLTASVDARGRGLGLKLWSEFIRRSRIAGYDGTINFCVEGDEMNRMMPVLARLLKLDSTRVFSVRFLSRLLRPVAPESGSPVCDEDIELFMELASVVSYNLPLRRLWTRAEAEWQCRGRMGAITVASRVGGRHGILTGTLTQVASTPPTTVVLLEDLLWGDLNAAERAELVGRFLLAAAARGARIASCPVLGYAPIDPLQTVKFRFSNRLLHTYLTLWNGSHPAPVDGLYIDVL